MIKEIGSQPVLLELNKNSPHAMIGFRSSSFPILEGACTNVEFSCELIPVQIESKTGV
jgi:hypothetical protein